MKKSVIIIIAVVFVISIALVNFLGVKPKVFNEVVYVSSISFVDENIKVSVDNEGKIQKSIRLSPDENGDRKYQINYTIGPEDATNKGVRYAISSKSATIDENGLVTFTKKGDAIVTIMPDDGSNCSDTLTISFRS